MQESTSARSDFDDTYLTCASRLLEYLDGDAYLEIAEAIALLYVEAGQLEQGVEHAERIPDAYARDSVLAVITAKAVASERDHFATELLETIGDPFLYNSAVEAMSIEFAGRGQFDEALSFADNLSDNASALASISMIYWQRGLKNEALDLARSIEFPEQCASALVQLARLSAQEDESLNLLADARRVAEEIESVELKVFALIEVASGYEQQSDPEQSLEALNRAFEVCEDFESAPVVGLSADFAEEEVLLQIMDGFLKLQDLSKATEVAEVIEDRFLLARANLRLAVARGGAGSAEYLDEPRAMIVKLQPYGEKEAEVHDDLIVELAMAYANCSDFAEARRIINLVTSDQKHRLALKELGKLCSNAKDEREVSNIEEDLRSQFDKVRYWLGIYDSTSSSQPELSETAMSKALARAESLERPVEQAEAFTEIALRFAKSEKAGQAERLFLATTNAATLIDGDFLKARSLLRLAKASQDIGRRPNQDEQPLLDEIR